LRLLLFLALSSGSVFVPALAAQQQPDSVGLPDIPGFHTLKGDLHLHTVFSDGQVWPSFRVFEARRDRLDFIALTDHIDYQGNPNQLERNYNLPHELGLAAARGSKLLVVKGAEISPRTPPYHANAIFLDDANVIPTDYMADMKGRFVMKDRPSRAELMAPFIAAKAQGAFITYNHPAYLYDWNHATMGADLFTPFHRELLSKGMLHGIEVVNGNRYYKKAHRIAMEHNLTLIAASDEHADIAGTYTSTHRPMTLVFAPDSSIAGLKEALFARRTAIWFRNFIIGRERELEPFFHAAVAITTEESARNAEPIVLIRIHNRSDVQFEIRVRSRYDFDTLPLGRLTLQPHRVTTLVLRPLWERPPEVAIQVTVENLMTGPEEELETTLLIRPAWKERK
jgi:hypothetical protein